MSLIDPSHFPVLQPQKAQTAASQLRTMGQGIETHTTNADTDWQGLSSCYRAPEGGYVTLLLKPAVATARDVKDAMTAAAGVLDNYASGLEGLRTRLAELQVEANEFRVEIFTTPYYRNYHTDGQWNDPIYWNLATIVYDWDQWPPTVQRNNELVAKAAAIMADLSQLESSYGQQILNLVDPSMRPEMCTSGSVFPVYGADQFLNSPVPWGQPQKRRYTNFGDNVYSTVHDWIGGTISSIVGFAGVKWDWPPGFSPSLAAESWLGLGMLGVGAAAVVIDPTAIPRAQHGTGFVSRSVNLYVSSSTGIVGYDYQAMLDGDDPWHQWKDDPQGTATTTVFNIASLIYGAKTAGSNVAWDVVSNAGPLIPEPGPGRTPTGRPTVPPPTGESCPTGPITNTTTSTTTPDLEDHSDSGSVTTTQPEGPTTGTTTLPPTSTPQTSPAGQTPSQTSSTTSSTTPTTVPVG